MSLSITTVASLHGRIIALIEDQTPEVLSAYPFHSVEKKAEVPGTGFRNFFVEIANVQALAGGIHGSGAEYSGELDVYMCYGGHDESNDDILISTDHIGLWIGINRNCDPVTPGLISLSSLGWRDEGAEPGRRWGAHQYVARFFARGLLAS